MNVYERQARALETIAHELKGIGKTLGQIKEIFSPEIQLINERLLKHMEVTKESPGTCFMTEEPCNRCSQMKDDKCKYLVRTGEPWPEECFVFEVEPEDTLRAYCGDSGLPCTGCTLGKCDYRQLEHVDDGFAYFDESLLDEDERTEGGNG